MTNPEVLSKADDAQVAQSAGSASPAAAAGDARDDGEGREVGVTAAVERGPAELSSDGEPVRPLPHAALDAGAGEARSTADL